MLLAAGFGTRLRPLTDRLPKCLVPIGDRPALSLIVESLRESLGEHQLLVNAHHRAAQVREYLKRELPEARLLEEQRILGTAGALSSAAPYLRESAILVANADILARPDCGALLLLTQSEVCALCLSPAPAGAGSVGVDRDGYVVRIRGEVFGCECRNGNYIGTAALHAMALKSMPGEGCFIGDWALPHLRKGGRIKAQFDPTPWMDIGTIARYLDANIQWLADRNVENWCAPDALVEPGARLRDAVVASRATVKQGVRVERSVVWPGACVQADVMDCVVLPEGVVVHRS